MVIKAPPQIKLDGTGFEHFKRARTGLIEALGVEERFNILLENYAEFEAELLQNALYYTLFDDDEWSRMAAVIHTLGRRLNNLLSTCRLYLDHTPGALRRMYDGNSQVATLFKEETKKEYDSVFSYRLMEAIRNYSQHSNLPVAHLAVSCRDFPGFERDLNQHVVIPSIDLERLKEDVSFKRSVLRELDAAGYRQIDIRMHVRKYVEALGRIHSHLQQVLSNELNTWDRLMSDLREQFESSWDGGSQAYVEVVLIDSEGELLEKSYLVEEVVKRRIFLAKRNRWVTSYSRQVVSNFAG